MLYKRNEEVIFLGATIQIVPHISNEIKNKIYEASTTSGANIVIT